jgi:O-antigen biosynthesis protein
MARSNLVKARIKWVIKKGLVTSKKVLAKSTTIKRAGKLVRNTLFPDVGPTLYNYARYAPTIHDYQKQLVESGNFKSKPLISVVMPTYNTQIEYLRECIESVLVQSYPHWELCIADDASPNKQTVEVIKEYLKQDKRIKFVQREKNGHISAATNSAIAIAKGEFIALLDHDDILWPNALFEIVATINKQPKVDFIYTDEDKIDEKGETHSYPFFKPDWSPEFLESCNYITHFSAIRKQLLDKVGGLRVGYEGAQDWDLFLRVTEESQEIVHISKVLYSWRIHEDSTAMDTDAKPYVYESQRKLLHDHIERLSKPALVKKGIIKQHASIEYKIQSQPLVTVIIAGGGHASGLKKCLRAAERHTDYKNTEWLILANSKQIKIRLEHSARLTKNCRIISSNQTLAEQYNLAAQKARGDYLVFLDCSLIVTKDHWIEFLLGDAQREGVAVTGGKVVNHLRDRFLRAAAATGIYGVYAPLLEGMPVEDIHYLRGLYGQSRRNVSILDGYFMVPRALFKQVNGFDSSVDNLFYADFCLKLLSEGFRHIYNPFIEVADQLNRTAGTMDDARDKQAVEVFHKRWRDYIENDPYLNPNFTRTNAQLEIK